MGYYVSLESTSINIPPSLFAPVCRHLLSTGFHTDHGNMNSNYYGIGERHYWYSWVDMKNLIERLNAGDLPGVLVEFGFDVIFGEDDSITDLVYDNKMGDEEKLFRAMAPALPGTQELFWRGEEGEKYKWTIKDHQFKVVDALITYPEEPNP
jgi:hypothetical protein